MVNEDLMRQLPKGIGRVAEQGPFFIRDNGGSYSVVVLTKILVTCGGGDSKDRATDLACSLNRVWNDKLEEFSSRLST